MQNLKSTFDAVNFTYYDNLCNEIDSKALKLQNNPSLKKELCKLSMEFVYLSPFIRAQIEEENIAEFLLSVEQPLERAIDKFIQKDVPFTAYLRKSLNLRIISFKGQKQREERQSRVMYQFIIPNLQDDFKVSETRHSYSNSNNKEITNVNINKLKYVFSKVPYLRKRFFIYFTSLIPYLPKNLIDIICKELSIDEQQTYKILQYLQTEIPLNKIEKIIEKRNSYY
ncbi:MAG: hypothetical protein HUK24_06830, partial [Sphaerochaetaceae bacterium]|nr:hypothetical protein [Sphaerochaetaceae bacterium]